MSDTTDISEGGESVDADTGNWLARNLWMVKGLVAAVALAGLGVLALGYFQHEMDDVMWAIFTVMAGLVLLSEIAFGVFQALQSA